jgi:hypothetical protein
MTSVQIMGLDDIAVLIRTYPRTLSALDWPEGVWPKNPTFLGNSRSFARVARCNNLRQPVLG